MLRALDARDAEDYELLATPTAVRLVRVVTPKGRVHVVMTSLLDPVVLPVAAFADLHHDRWRLAAATPRRLKSVIAEIALNLQKLLSHRYRPRKPQPKPL